MPDLSRNVPARFRIGPGDPLTAFALGPLIETPYPGIAAPMPDTQGYVFKNGFVDVPEMPCRTALRAELAARGVPFVPPFEPTSLNLPGISRRLEFSGFWHEPTRLSRWARTRVAAQEAGPLKLRIKTCGGVHLWLDGSPVKGFEPYTRNAIAETIRTIQVPRPGAELIVLMEEMAERDTVFFAELTHLDGPELMLEPDPALGADAARDLATLATGLRPARHVFGAGEPLELVTDHAPASDVAIAANVIPSDHLTHHPPIGKFSATMRQGAMSLTLDGSDELPDGYHPLALTIGEGVHRVDRKIAVARMARAETAWSDALDGRKHLALTHAAAVGEPRAGRLLAHLELGLPWDTTCETILIDTCQIVSRRKDCSDFVLVPLLWIVLRYGDALPLAALKAARDAILGFRYWMDEPGNDAMWFWSENHVLCFHVSQYLAGRAYPDAVFPNAGLTGRDHARRAEERLVKWFEAVEPHGLAEWNSAAYYPIDFIGLLGLEALAGDDLRARAKLMLDAIFEMVALHTMGGVTAGSMGRAYDKELKAGPLPELAPFAAVAWGNGWLTRGVAALPMFAASNYAPPDHLGDLAAVPEATTIEATYRQGHGGAGRLHLHKCPSIQLSVGAGGDPGARGHQQHVIDVQAAADPFARLWINHPGEDDPFGSERPSHWAGNGVMPHVVALGPTAMLLYRLGDEAERPYTHAYAPRAAFDEVIEGEDWRVLRSGRGVILLKATGPIRTVTHGPGAGRELRHDGVNAGWMVRIAELEARGIDKFAKAARDMRLGLDAGGTRLTLTETDGAPLTLEWRTGLFQGDQKLPCPPATTRPRITITGPMQERP